MPGRFMRELRGFIVLVIHSHLLITVSVLSAKIHWNTNRNFIHTPYYTCMSVRRPKRAQSYHLTTLCRNLYAVFELSQIGYAEAHRKHHTLSEPSRRWYVTRHIAHRWTYLIIRVLYPQAWPRDGIKPSGWRRISETRTDKAIAFFQNLKACVTCEQQPFQVQVGYDYCHAITMRDNAPIESHRGVIRHIIPWLVNHCQHIERQANIRRNV